MPLRFRIRPSQQGLHPERVLDVEPADEVTLGRRAGCAIELPFAAVSALHARLLRRPGSWAVEDLGSVNGTFLGSRRLPPNTPETLFPGDLVRLADIDVRFEGDRAVAPSGTESTATIARRLVNDLFGAMHAAEVPRLVVEASGDRGLALSLATLGKVYRVGRGLQCELVLDDADASREHATFERRWEGVFVRDLGSKNGVEIDGERIAGPRRLRDCDVLVIGSTRLRLEEPEDRYLQRMRQQEEVAEPAPATIEEAPVTSRAVRSEEEATTLIAPAQRRRQSPVVITMVAAGLLVGIVAAVAWLLLAS